MVRLDARLVLADLGIGGMKSGNLAKPDGSAAASVSRDLQINRGAASFQAAEVSFWELQYRFEIAVPRRDPPRRIEIASLGVRHARIDDCARSKLFPMRRTPLLWILSCTVTPCARRDSL